MQIPLLVKEVFCSIQGEGPFSGCPAVFVRLGGCNLFCPKCDTEFWDAREYLEPEELIAKVIDFLPPNRLVVITGGEPMMQPLSELVGGLLHASCLVQIETNGTLAHIGLPYGHPNLTIVCSPKTSTLDPDLEPRIDAYKYVIEAGHVSTRDGLPAHCFSSEDGIPARPRANFPKNRIYVQPCDEKTLLGVASQRNKENLDAAIRISLDFGYTLCLQIHKILNLR